MSLKLKVNKLGDFINENFFNILLVVILILNVAPILAPIFAKLNWYWPAKAIYFVYSFFCHQLNWRSLYVFDHQFAWCARCTAIWLNVLLTGFLIKYFKVKNVKWYWILIMMLPMALDGGIQTIATLLGFTGNGAIYYISNTPVRFITGSLFGMGFGLWIWTTLADGFSKKQEEKRKRLLSWLQLVFISAVISLVFYILALFAWNNTSLLNPPAGYWDFAVKTPVLPQEFLIRSKDTI